MSTARKLSATAREIARLLKDALDDSPDWNQSTLAPVVGVDQSQLSKLVRGLRPITVDQLYLMCDALGLNVIEIWREAEAVAAARGSVRDETDTQDGSEQVRRVRRKIRDERSQMPPEEGESDAEDHPNG